MQEQELQEELTLSDGQTEGLPELEQLNNQAETAGLQTFSQTTSDRYYTKEEFQGCFTDFLTFLKSPQTSADAFEALRAEGQQLAADKVFEMAQNYKFLRFLIDKRTRLMHDMAVIGLFMGCEANAIVYNWTGISLFEKGKIWLKSKIKQRAQSVQSQGKRSVWGFLARRGAEKPQKPESSQESSAA